MAFRLGGMTIRADETYSGRDVIRLLDIAFENGRRNGRINIEQEKTKAFWDGHAAGYIKGVEEAKQNNRKVDEFLRLGRELFCDKWQEADR